MSYRRQRLGKTGEDRAVVELTRRGYAILARRYRTRHGEIDIEAQDGPTVVFVEVKARTTGAFGHGVEAVGALKQRRLVSMAEDYLMRHRLGGCPCRFDVVAVDGMGEGKPAITLIRDAFWA